MRSAATSLIALTRPTQRGPAFTLRARPGAVHMAVITFAANARPSSTTGAAILPPGLLGHRAPFFTAGWTSPCDARIKRRRQFARTGSSEPRARGRPLNLPGLRPYRAENNEARGVSPARRHPHPLCGSRRNRHARSSSSVLKKMRAAALNSAVMPPLSRRHHGSACSVRPGTCACLAKPSSQRTP